MVAREVESGAKGRPLGNPQHVTVHGVNCNGRKWWGMLAKPAPGSRPVAEAAISTATRWFDAS